MQFTPDIDQLRLIDAPNDARVVVTAGPGSGKTFTAAQRLIRMIRENESEGRYLAISFSNAAAQALEGALTLAGLRGRVEVGTIDSWAGRFNRNFADLVALQDLSDYEDGIQLAINTLAEVQDEMIAEIDHLIIDEAQDIFGLRAELLTILCSKGWVAGWTMLGDLAQKIYDFDADKELDKESLLEKMSSRNVSNEIVHMALLTDHRCSNSELFNIRTLGEGLRTNRDGGVVSNLWAEFSNFPVLTTLEQLNDVAMVFAGEDASTGILVRNNRLALAISESLNCNGVAHKITDGSESVVVPDWVLSIGSCRSQSELHEMCPSFIDPSVLALEVAKICSPGRADRFDMKLFVQRVREKRLPRLLMQQSTSGLTVSTIHQSKGLEYNRVVLEIEKPVNASGELDSETRVLFVGLTRASDEIFRFHSAQKHNTERHNSRSFDFEWKNGKRKPSGIELKTNDLQFLRRPPRVGELEIRLIGYYEDSVPRYALFEHGENVCIANVSEAFGRAVRSKWWSQCPLMFSGLVPTGTQTIVRPPTFEDAIRDSLLVHVPVYRSMIKVGE